MLQIVHHAIASKPCFSERACVSDLARLHGARLLATLSMRRQVPAAHAVPLNPVRSCRSHQALLQHLRVRDHLGAPRGAGLLAAGHAAVEAVPAALPDGHLGEQRAAQALLQHLRAALRCSEPPWRLEIAGAWTCCESDAPDA